MRVFVLDKHDRPLMPCHPARARTLLDKGRAVVARRIPFAIRLTDREQGAVQALAVKIDPGSKTTGIALVAHGKHRGAFVVSAIELHHRGAAIKAALLARRQVRRGRRSRHTRYRPARFDNRARPAGWLAPSLRHRVETTMAQVARLRRWAPVTAISQELVRFDTQALESPDIEGAQYQQGTLAGYEVREYLLEKWQRRCAYCDAEHLPLQIEHIVPRAAGGSDRIANLALACERCNRAKGTQPIAALLAGQPARLACILAQAKAPLRDAAAVNSTRWALFGALKATGLPVEAGSGGRTKFNRTRQHHAKAHWIDAACVGPSGEVVDLRSIRHVVEHAARGRGHRQATCVDKHGFPRTRGKAVKRLHGYQSGDRVRLVQPHGKHAGTHEGTVSIRATGQFDLKRPGHPPITAPHQRFRRLERFQGYITTRRTA